MNKLMLAGLAFAGLAAVAVSAVYAASMPDGALIHNSGSTNTAAYAIKIRSNGQAEYTVARGDTKQFTLDKKVTDQFFSDVRAARSNPGTPGRCMKSASFGTTTTVQWHGWSSVDLQCPPFTPAVQALNADVHAILSAANIDAGPRRIPLPREPRMIPSASPEVSPT